MVHPKHVSIFLPAVAFVLAVQSGQQKALSQNPYLRGKVEQKNSIAPAKNAPANYSIAPSDDDPFSSSGNGDPFTPPAQSNQPGAWSGGYPVEQAAQPPRRAAITQDGPDESAEMQIAWDAWHRRVGQAVFARFNAMSKAVFKFSEPLACKVSYAVTRQGQITSIKVLEPSSNMMFDTLVSTSLKTLSGDVDTLQFPAGSHRQSVEKVATFTQNYGVEGFRCTTGDKESVRTGGK